MREWCRSRGTSRMASPTTRTVRLKALIRVLAPRIGVEAAAVHVAQPRRSNAAGHRRGKQLLRCAAAWSKLDGKVRPRSAPRACLHAQGSTRELQGAASVGVPARLLPLESILRRSAVERLQQVIGGRTSASSSSSRRKEEEARHCAWVTRISVSNNQEGKRESQPRPLEDAFE